MLDNSGINCYLSNITYQKEWTRWGHFPSSDSQTPSEPPRRRATTTFHFPFDHFPFSCSLISHPLMPLFAPLPPPASWGPCAGGAITEGGIDSFAVMWFGLQRGTAQSNTLSFFFFFSFSPSPACPALLPPPSAAVHVFSNRPINTTQIRWPLFFPLPFSPLPPSASHNLCSQCVCKKKKKPPILLSHTHSIISNGKLQWPHSPLFHRLYFHQISTPPPPY